MCASYCTRLCYHVSWPPFLPTSTSSLAANWECKWKAMGGSSSCGLDDVYLRLVDRDCTTCPIRNRLLFSSWTRTPCTSCTQAMRVSSHTRPHALKSWSTCWMNTVNGPMFQSPGLSLILLRSAECIATCRSSPSPRGISCPQYRSYFFGSRGGEWLSYNNANIPKPFDLVLKTSLVAVTFHFTSLQCMLYIVLQVLLFPNIYLAANTFWVASVQFHFNLQLCGLQKLNRSLYRVWGRGMRGISVGNTNGYHEQEHLQDICSWYCLKK